MTNKGSLIVVTGASSGIGEEVARRLHATGAQLVLVGRNEDRLSRVQDELLGSLSFACDLRNEEKIEELGEFIENHARTHRQKLLSLVNNAGVFVRGSFSDTSVETWKEQWEVNMLGPVRLTKRLSPLLKSSNPSSVLNISSTLGIKSVPQTSAYSAVKAAMISWTRTLALEWAKDQVRVNCLCPGLVDTPIHSFFGGDDKGQERRTMHSMQPLGRLGSPSDIAEAAEFLISERSSWTTGAVWTVDGGIHLL